MEEARIEMPLPGTCRGSACVLVGHSTLLNSLCSGTYAVRKRKKRGGGKDIQSTTLSSSKVPFTPRAITIAITITIFAFTPAFFLSLHTPVLKWMNNDVSDLLLFYVLQRHQKRNRYPTWDKDEIFKTIRHSANRVLLLKTNFIYTSVWVSISFCCLHGFNQQMSSASLGLCISVNLASVIYLI